jgi:deoxycytidine triphosphate deaminase
MGKSTLSTLTSVQDEDVQPNAVDLRVAKIFRIEPGSVFEISNEHKKHRRTREIQPDAEGYLYLEPGHYEVVMENIINVGANEAGWVITRSTLNRNGLFITSGLYDSGYHGAMAGALHVTVGSAKIKKGTRIGQYLCFDSESVSMYNGDYGLNKAHDKKYE